MPPSEGLPDCGGPLGGASGPGRAVLGCARRGPLAAAGSVEAAGTLPPLLLGVFFLDMVLSVLLLLPPDHGLSHAPCPPRQTRTRTRPAAAAEAATAAATAASQALSACPAPASPQAAQPLRPGLLPPLPMAALRRGHANKPVAPGAGSRGLRCASQEHAQVHCALWL